MQTPTPESLARAHWYSPLSFLRTQAVPLANEFLSRLSDDLRQGILLTFDEEVRLFLRPLPWDTEYFTLPTYRLDFTEWAPTTLHPDQAVAHTASILLTHLAGRHPHYYLFAEIPSEDLATLQGLTAAGFRLLETRLTYFSDSLPLPSSTVRFPVRTATLTDVAELRETAANTRNSYDRFHADPFFSEPVADQFLATFAENSVKGYADVVLVPNDGGPATAFSTIKLRPEFAQPSGMTVGQIVLSAVAPARKGWHAKLVSESAFWLKERGAQLLYMVTQSTNRPVIRNCEKLGLRYGRCSHILAFHP